MSFLKHDLPIRKERRQIMLPEMRSGEETFSVPKFNIKRDDIKGFMNELK